MADLIKSRIEKVQVYRSGALVTRVVDSARADWPEEIFVGPLPLSVEDDSLRAGMIPSEVAESPVQVLELEVELVVPPLPKSSPDDLLQALENVRQKRNALQQRISRIKKKREVLAGLELELAPDFEDKPPQPLAGQVWRKAMDWQHESKIELLQEQTQLERELESIEEALVLAQRALDEAHSQQQADVGKMHKRLRLRLAGTKGAPACRLQFSYLIQAAQWRPAYVLRVKGDGQSAELSMRAMISQGSGEVWDAVQLQLSTSSWQRSIALPELQSKRIGRAQSRAARPAWREPPKDGETLFADYDRAVLQRGPLPATQSPLKQNIYEDDQTFADPAASFSAGMPDELDFADVTPVVDGESVMAMMADIEEEVLDIPAAQLKGRMSKKAMALAAPPPAAPMKKSRSRAPGRPVPAAARRRSRGSNAGMVSERLGGRTENHLGINIKILNYSGYLIESWQSPERGQLRAVKLADRLQDLSPQELDSVRSTLLQLRHERMNLQSFSSRTVSLSSSAGHYDYSYRASGRVSIPGDGKVHNVPVLSADSPVQMTLVVVPQKSSQAVRVASLQNPLHSPLLAGPVEVFLQREFLVDTEIKTLPAGARFDVGLGVEEAIKVARNTAYKEETQGLLGGDLSLRHEVNIEIVSGLTHDVSLEVRERIPVRDNESEKDIRIKVDDVRPPWQDWNQGLQDRLQGGKRWRMPLAAGASQKISYSYKIEIDSKNELVGGNRREEVQL